MIVWYFSHSSLIFQASSLSRSLKTGKPSLKKFKTVHLTPWSPSPVVFNNFQRPWYFLGNLRTYLDPATGCVWHWRNGINMHIYIYICILCIGIYSYLMPIHTHIYIYIHIQIMYIYIDVWIVYICVFFPMFKDGFSNIFPWYSPTLSPEQLSFSFLILHRHGHGVHLNRSRLGRFGTIVEQYG